MIRPYQPFIRSISSVRLTCSLIRALPVIPVTVWPPCGSLPAETVTPRPRSSSVSSYSSAWPGLARRERTARAAASASE